MLKVKYRNHECLNCGHEQLIQTNHLIGCLDYCHNCSWKPSFGKDIAVPMFGNQAYRRFKCIEPEADEQNSTVYYNEAWTKER